MSLILTDENFEKEVKGTDKLVLVDFFATWCEPCTMLAPILEKVAEELKEKLVLMKVNVDDTPKISGNLGIEKIPTVVLFKNGNPISGFVGMAPEASIKEWITTAEKESSKETPSEEPSIEELIEGFEKHAKVAGITLNPDKKTVERIAKGLILNEKKHGAQYCPCRRVTGDKEADKKIICPCIYHKDEVKKDGHCLCNLYVK